MNKRRGIHEHVFHVCVCVYDNVYTVDGFCVWGLVGHREVGRERGWVVLTQPIFDVIKTERSV